MESYEATRLVFSRIQSLDPENASKIMGVLLIQDHGEKDMIRLAYGPDSLLHSVIVKAKNHLVLSSNNSCALPTTPTNPAIPSRIVPSNGFTRPSPIAISPSPPSPGSYSPWSLSGLSENLRSPGGGGAVGSISSPSYAAVVNGTNGNIGNSIMSNGSFSYSNTSNSSSSISHFNNSSSTCGLNVNVNVNDIVDDYTLQEQQFSFLNDSQSEMMKNPLTRSDSMGFNSYMNSNWVDSLNGHRRSCSVSDVCFGSDESASGFGWKPCLYFARGFCKNGSTCRFVHGGFGESSDPSSTTIGSPSKLDGFEQCHELLLRSKAAAAAAQQQRLAATSQLMAAGVSFPYNKCMNLLDSPRSAAAALMMGEELPRFARCRSERNDFSAMALGGMMNSSSRQIYLTFPADSTFREEDVSNYFSIYGPVQDVRIPYQQKRMFGFVTFVYPETVKLILAKGNPHFVCESRVLVKPYKEKGKIPDKKHQHQQQLERGEFSACSSPTGLDSRDPYDLQLGARMFYNTQEMLLRRKLEEQADLQQAIEFQGRRLMNLQLLDLKNHHQSNVAIPSPASSHTHINQTLALQSDGQESPEEGDSVTNAVVADQLPEEVKTSCNQDNGNGNSNEESPNFEESDLPECLEHILPDSLFASPTKLAGNRGAVFSTALADSDESTSTSTTTTSNNNPLMPATSNLNMASLKSCFMQMPRFSSENGAIGM